MKILDTEIDQLDRQSLQAKIERVLADRLLPPIFLVTANPEIVLRAHRDPSFNKVLNQATLRLADGFGLVLAARLFGRKLKRITGRDLLEMIVGLASGGSKKLLLVLKQDGLTPAGLAKECLQGRFPRLSCRAVDIQPEQSFGDGEAEIVLVNFGAPDQERWIVQNRQNFPRARLFAGIGGALDTFCGVLAAPPRPLSALGLEWFWRLVIQPRRFRRIFNAVIVFPLLFFSHHLFRNGR